MNSHGECGKTTYFNKHFRCLNMRKDVLLMKRDNHVDFHPYVVFMQSMRAYRVGVTFPNGVQFTPQDSMLDENSENIVFFDRKNVWKIPLAEKNLTLVDDVFVLWFEIVAVVYFFCLFVLFYLTTCRIPRKFLEPFSWLLCCWSFCCKDMPHHGLMIVFVAMVAVMLLLVLFAWLDL